MPAKDARCNLVPLCAFHYLTVIHRWGWTLRLHPHGATTATSPDAGPCIATARRATVHPGKTAARPATLPEGVCIRIADRHTCEGEAVPDQRAAARSSAAR